MRGGSWRTVVAKKNISKEIWRKAPFSRAVRDWQ
jgi:hypothetical protein